MFFAVLPPLFVMEPQRPRQFCADYQLPRVVPGRPMCIFPKWNCPYGRHECQHCGNKGHGAGDCRQAEGPEEPMPPAQEPPPEATAIVPFVPPPLEPPPPAPPPPKSFYPPFVAPTPKAVVVPGFGKKGEGKDANYGTSIEPPSGPLPHAELPPILQASSSCAAVIPEIPPPIAATTQDVEEWMTTGYKPLTNISQKIPPEVGESILWRGVKTGKKGCLSTKVEYFNGKVRHVEVEDDGELYVYLD